MLVRNIFVGYLFQQVAAVPPIKYYEISSDFEVIATMNGTSYFDKTLQGLTTYQYGIVSIDVEVQRSAPAVITNTTP